MRIAEQPSKLVGATPESDVDAPSANHRLIQLSACGLHFKMANQAMNSSHSDSAMPYVTLLHPRV